jgi:hypothetical protein
VVLLGGVAEVDELAAMKWSCVGGKVYNFYSREDATVGRSLKLIRPDAVPCGR